MQSLFVEPYGIYMLPMTDAESCFEALRHEGFEVYTLPEVDSELAFFDQVRTAIPLSPQLSGRANWNAFTDSLWNGIDECGHPKVSILWPHAETMRRADRSAFHTAVECMQDVISDFRREAAKTSLDTKNVVIIILDAEYTANCNP